MTCLHSVDTLPFLLEGRDDIKNHLHQFYSQIFEQRGKIFFAILLFITAVALIALIESGGTDTQTGTPHVAPVSLNDGGEDVLEGIELIWAGSGNSDVLPLEELELDPVTTLLVSGANDVPVDTSVEIRARFGNIVTSLVQSELVLETDGSDIVSPELSAADWIDHASFITPIVIKGIATFESFDGLRRHEIRSVPRYIVRSGEGFEALDSATFWPRHAESRGIILDDMLIIEAVVDEQEQPHNIAIVRGLEAGAYLNITEPLMEDGE